MHESDPSDLTAAERGLFMDPSISEKDPSKDLAVERKREKEKVGEGEGESRRRRRRVS